MDRIELRSSTGRTLRVGISHDWLLNRRGAERVLDVFSGLFPDSPVYTLFLRPKAVSRRISSHSLNPARINVFPRIAAYYRYLLPLYPHCIESLRAEDVDFLLSIHHSVAKALPHSPEVPHICYCLTPMRYVWEPELYGPTLNGSWQGWAMRLMAPRLKQWDLESNSRVTYFVAISRTVQRRIAKYYGRESAVIYPGVDIDFFQPNGRVRSNYYLIVSALVPHKRLDVAVDAFRENGRHLIIVGDGPLRSQLERRSGPATKFLGRVSDNRLRNLYSEAKAVLLPGVEDFGLVPVEAQATGCPVIALGQGGATETVIPEETGLFFSTPSSQSLKRAVEQFDALKLNSDQIRRNAERFSIPAFTSNWRAYLSGLSLD